MLTQCLEDILRSKFSYSLKTIDNKTILHTYSKPNIVEMLNVLKIIERKSIDFKSMLWLMGFNKTFVSHSSLWHQFSISLVWIFYSAAAVIMPIMMPNHCESHHPQLKRHRSVSPEVLLYSQWFFMFFQIDYSWLVYMSMLSFAISCDFYLPLVTFYVFFYLNTEWKSIWTHWNIKRGGRGREKAYIQRFPTNFSFAFLPVPSGVWAANAVSWCYFTPIILLLPLYRNRHTNTI